MLTYYIYRHDPYDPPDPIPGVHYGDVYGILDATGHVYSRTMYDDEKVFLQIHGDEENHTSSFYMRIWNISEVRLGDISHGVYFYRNISLDNESIIVDAPDCYFYSLVQHGTFTIEYENVSIGLYDDEYMFSYQFITINGSAVLGHQTGRYQDFQLFWTNVRIGNETVWLQEGQFGFPENEHANIEFMAKGSGRIYPIPTFLVNGTVTITDFLETTSDGRIIEDHDRFVVTSNNITVITRQGPVTDVAGYSEPVIIEPWSVEVRIPEEIEETAG
jgi:hypothetical protein